VQLQVVFKNCSRPREFKLLKELQFRDILLDFYPNVDVLLKNRNYYANTKDSLCDYARAYRNAWTVATKDLTDKERKNARFELHYH